MGSYSKIRHIQEVNQKLEMRMLVEKMTPSSLSSPRAQDTKEWQKFFNQYYKLTLPVDGNWEDPTYNLTMKKYLEEKGIPVWVCKKGDGYCNDNDEGQVTAKGSDISKSLNARNLDMSTPKKTNAKINTTNDKSYDYKLENGKYYFKGKGSLSKKYPNWIESTGKGLESIKQNVKF